MPFAALVSALVLAGSLAHASARELQPKTYVSPSGLWSLRVEPLTRDGTGEADYTLTGGGREAWKARHPFALCDAYVTDDGRVAGYAYVEDTPDPSDSSLASLHVVVLSPKGDVVLDEVHAREESAEESDEGPTWSTPPYPCAQGHFVQPDLGRFVVQIDGGDPNRRLENWWGYDLVTGKPLFQVSPMLVFETEDWITGACGVRAVPKTPLVLVHWFRFDPYKEISGATFQLLDAEYRPVWRFDLPNDYEVLNEKPGHDLVNEIWAQSAILATRSQGFELRHAADSQRVSYAVTPDVGGKWNVREVAREPYLEVEPNEPPPVEPYRPVLLREITLDATAPPKGDIRDIFYFGFDDESRLRFVRDEEEGASLVLLSEAGEVRRETRVPAEVGTDPWPMWFPLTSPLWLAVVDANEEDARARAWRVNEETGAYEELDDFPARDVERVLELGGGRLLVLATWYLEYTIAHTLIACDARGRAIWWIAEDGEDPTKPDTITDVTVTDEGDVVVLDATRGSLLVFSDHGEYLEAIDLTVAWGQEPTNLGSIVADHDGGVLVHDWGGTPPLWRMTLDGSVRAKFAARMSTGEPRSEYSGRVQVAPDGSMWTTDGHEFVGLDESGVADVHFGTPARADWLEAPGAAAIDSTFGRILIADERTSAIHVFDGEGRRVAVCQPRDEDLELMRNILSSVLRCDSTGGVRYGRHRFGPDGTSLGTQALKGSRASFVPGREAYWTVTPDGPTRFGADGEPELCIPKLAGGHWWSSIEQHAVAADGRLAVFDAHQLRERAGKAQAVELLALFDAEGKPLGQFELPAMFRPILMVYAGPWVLLQRFGEARLLDTRDGRLIPIDVSAHLDPRGWNEWGLAPSGTELWVVQHKLRRLTKLSLPN